MKPSALEKFLANHKTTCSVHVYSGKRKCTCGRDEAYLEYLQMKQDSAGAGVALQIGKMEIDYQKKLRE